MYSIKFLSFLMSFFVVKRKRLTFYSVGKGYRVTYQNNRLIHITNRKGGVRNV